MRSAAFMLAAAARPSMVGAVLPSSRYLARAMAAAADGASRLIELGAGTGAITEALAERHLGVPMVVVERELRLARHLHRRFPEAEVHAASAHTVLDALDGDVPGAVVVSSLPFRSLPDPWRQTTIESVERYLLAAPGRRLIQYTYQPRAPFVLSASRAGALRWQREAIVWRNLPPAGVWTLTAR